jgi:hypothetical protein
MEEYKEGLEVFFYSYTIPDLSWKMSPRSDSGMMYCAER